MAKDKITDLRHHLFAQLERLSDDEEMAKKETRESEIRRSKAIAHVSQAIINSVQLELNYAKITGNRVDKPSFLSVEEPLKKK
jgi:hypothetical protein